MLSNQVEDMLAYWCATKYILCFFVATTCSTRKFREHFVDPHCCSRESMGIVMSVCAQGFGSSTCVRHLWLSTANRRIAFAT